MRLLVDRNAYLAAYTKARLYSSNTYELAQVFFSVKHDIFLGDVNACFLSLKKAVRDLHDLSASSSHLQMGQPIIRYVYHLRALWIHTSHARSDAVTVQLDPAMSLGLNLDDFLGVRI